MSVDVPFFYNNNEILSVAVMHTQKCNEMCNEMYVIY